MPLVLKPITAVTPDAQDFNHAVHSGTMPQCRR